MLLFSIDYVQFCLTNVAIFALKILAFLIYRGNILESVCKIVYCELEQESVKIPTIDRFLAEIPD